MYSPSFIASAWKLTVSAPTKRKSLRAGSAAADISAIIIMKPIMEERSHAQL